MVERWEPVRRIAMVVRRAGPRTVAAYLLAFAVLRAALTWLDVAFSRAAGPHEPRWWSGTAGTVDLAVDALVVPLQLALVAWALFHLSSQAVRPPAPAATPVAAAAGR